MNTTKRIQSFAASVMLTALVGAPALADDTELLLINPNTAEVPKPNVLFILDSSGSMTREETTKRIYDATRDYSGGGCDNDYLYWTDVDTVPSCDAANTRKILKTAFVCASAGRQLAGIGTYTDNMVQLRNGGSGFFSVFLGLSATRWQQLEPGNEVDFVECKGDRLEDGSGADTFARRGAIAGGLFENAYSDDPEDEVSWGSWPTSQTITVYDGNYLNYRAIPEDVDQSRTNIMKDVTKAVLASVDDVNVGIMRFNGSEGGVVIQGVTDLDSNRAAIDAAIDAIPASGQTPLAETLYESARYWRGLTRDYADGASVATDAGALVGGSGNTYQAPQSQVCTRNFNVLLSDGEPTSDVGAATRAPLLPDWGTTLGRANCDGAAVDGQCLDDVAEYLYQGDIAPTERGLQTVITHTIGFTSDISTLEEAAARGGGEYFRADNVEELTQALLTIVANITERSLSFSAPAVAVNTFNRTRNLNDLYLTTFAAKQTLRWPGNLKKFRIADGEIVDQNGAAAVNPTTGFFADNAQSFWSSMRDGNNVEMGGAVEQLPAPDQRRLFTNITANADLTDNGNALSLANKDSFELADLGLTGSPDEPTKEQLIEWARGVDVTDVDNDPATTVRRFMGDPLHSQPAAVVYGGSETNPEAVIFTATNDGYVHAIDGATGKELWAFIPSELLPNLSKLFFDPAAQYKNYGVDGDIVPVVLDKNGDGQIESADGDFVKIVFGMRRGGNAYYALDVTNRNSPRLMWRVSASSFGQTWSTPSIARISIDGVNQNAEDAVVVIGGGYDTVHDSLAHPATPDASGAGVYFLDLDSGDILWRAGPDSGANLIIPKMTRAIPTQVRVIDISGDGYADRMYASDMGGQVLRFDIFNGEVSNNLVAGGVIARLGAEGMASPDDSDARRFYAAPDISIFNDTLQSRRFIAISLGSGYRAHPLDNTPTERFYSLRDPDVFNALQQTDYDSYDIIGEDTLVEVAGDVRVTVGTGNDGWMLTLPPDQKVLEESVTFNNEIFFVAFSPDNAAAAACSAGLGRNFLYRVNVLNGDPIVPELATLAEADADAARVTDLAQGGIAPTPQFLFPTPDSNCSGAACNPPPLGCVGVECFDPGFQNNPVRTLWTQDGIE